MGDFGSGIYERSRRSLLTGASEIALLKSLREGLVSGHSKTLENNDVVHLGDILPRGHKGGTDFEVPEFAFVPDPWSKALLRGLSRFGKQRGFDGKVIAELGVGTGVNASYILSNYSPTALYASDINGACTELAARNVVRTVNAGSRRKFIPVLGDQNLAGWLEGVPRGTVDVVYGCLPQVVKAEEIDLHEGDNAAHYYDPAKYPSERHHLGLGLNEFALKQLLPLLPQGGTVILNLSGRPGKEAALEKMFRDCGYEPKLLHEEVIEQHSGTSLATLAAVEARNGHRFEFFTSKSGSLRSQITATEAEKMRLAGVKVYHKIYVIAGEKI